MKKFKMLTSVVAAAALAFGLSSCSDTEEDEKLILTITQNDTVVSIDYPDDYDGMEVTVVYNVGAEPVITFDTTQEPPTVNASKCTVYTEPFIQTFEGDETSVVLYARAYYYNKSAFKYALGPVSTKTLIKPSSSLATKTATGKKAGNFTFTLSETGNSNTTHYFDTYSSNVFKFNDDYPNVYYQTQFSWKGNGKGNWYLYMRDINNGLIKTDGSTAFVAHGTYTGDCFNSTSGVVTPGKITLKNSDNTTEEVTVVVEDKTYFDADIKNSIEASTTDNETQYSGSAGFAK